MQMNGEMQPPPKRVKIVAPNEQGLDLQVVSLDVIRLGMASPPSPGAANACRVAAQVRDGGWPPSEGFGNLIQWLVIYSSP